MDSMDWFDPGDDQARTQVQALNRAMKIGGKVLLRSAGLKPWYTSVFENNGFSASRVSARLPGTCIDRQEPRISKPSKSQLTRAIRVNMYASAWICTKVQDLAGNKEPTTSRPALLRSRSSTPEEIHLES